MEYIRTLENELLKRKEINYRYSIRAFSKYLGIQSSTLSAVLKKNRHLSFKDAEAIALKLFNEPTEANKFIISYLKVRTQQTDEHFVQSDHLFFPIIAEWEYGAVLSLMDTVDFTPHYQWITKRLGITIEKSREVVNHLKKVGLLLVDHNGQWIKIHKSFQTSTDVNSLALRLAHKSELQLATQKQETIPVNEREFGSMSFAAEKKNLPKIKKQIREFIDRLERTYETKDSNEVYLMSYQLFPLTNELPHEKH
jgi:uncharacterized protein (TIGR02147 family)